MAFWVKETWGTLWNPKQQGKTIRGSVSTSEKMQDSDDKKYSNWNARFVGKAMDKIAGMPERTNFKIISAKISIDLNEADGVKKSYTNLVIFDIELNEENSKPNQPTNAPKKTAKPTENQAGDDDSSDDELPF